MECKNCPYYDDTGLSVWCDKVGGRIDWYGVCSDVDAENIHKSKHITSKQKRKNKRERDLKYKNHLKNLVEMGNGYPWIAEYIDEKFVRGQGYVKVNKPYYIRLYRSHNGKHSGSKYHKKQSNKRIRHYKGELSNGRSCFKLYDYWWEMY